MSKSRGGGALPFQEITPRLGSDELVKRLKVSLLAAVPTLIKARTANITIVSVLCNFLHMLSCLLCMYYIIWTPDPLTGVYTLH